MTDEDPVADAMSRIHNSDPPGGELRREEWPATTNLNAARTNFPLPWRGEGQFVIAADGRSVCKCHYEREATLIASAVTLSDVSLLESCLREAIRRLEYVETVAPGLGGYTSRAATVGKFKHILGEPTT